MVLFWLCVENDMFCSASQRKRGCLWEGMASWCLLSGRHWVGSGEQNIFFLGPASSYDVVRRNEGRQLGLFTPMGNKAPWRTCRFFSLGFM